MNFDWIDFFDFADELYSKADQFKHGEAVHRTVTNRAYYAAFGVGMTFAVTRGFRPKGTGDDHHTLRTYYRNLRGQEELSKKIASALAKMYDNRRQVDYEATLRSPALGLAHANLELAKKILSDINSLRNLLPPP